MELDTGWPDLKQSNERTNLWLCDLISGQILISILEIKNKLRHFGESNLGPFPLDEMPICQICFCFDL
ncbi:hypothetical protein MANES_10G082300v8 [Manihot esculenta]|uniref:Uncharacterized protein n=2 Tax=Manihot esculenta TaxID=3983 RepID=A0ACB7H1Q4_MANES|nr:hypothetical protein MANES_10G082300v8 [Manihot esculenta]OAY39285.1 hypothetical protein MANES_10G082300v8 [Manihot esculenta]